ncbi:GNAT family N-acetyltransferase [Notoacmeibacter sp. MSK16QG-6]|uniref:GNAT family N-acetyltransferase n=1 Tax=Notoacmeibacter sp. MSK16QG-6 TaxID=2957982 RepID=UPI0020A1A57D|nr:GNAT family N-acyltransferase [Notoacmeibacter sp. MSK16QG-6]MCP1198911.1 GNAT family N-acetyltransferase [Notoacmeibacter sp. MSK16QG-6]
MAVGVSRIRKIIDPRAIVSLPLRGLPLRRRGMQSGTSLSAPVFETEKTAPRPILGQSGALAVRLASNSAEIEAAQRLRCKVFGRQRLSVSGNAPATDHDIFDSYCDHLIVLDESLTGSLHDRIVGTYRLLSPEAAKRAGRFYSDAEFDLRSLMARHPNRRFLELGRSCVLPAYRGKRIIDLLWQGIWSYCLTHRIDTMVGCASFAGTVPAAHAEALSFLAHHAPTDRAFACSAQDGRGVPTDMMPVEAILTKRALGALPPLIKGYLRIGATFSHEAVIDEDFGTVDVLTILPVERIAGRYLNHFTPRAMGTAKALAA